MGNGQSLDAWKAFLKDKNKEAIASQQIIFRKLVQGEMDIRNEEQLANHLDQAVRSSPTENDVAMCKRIWHCYCDKPTRTLPRQHLEVLVKDCIGHGKVLLPKLAATFIAQLTEQCRQSLQQMCAQLGAQTVPSQSLAELQSKLTDVHLSLLRDAQAGLAEMAARQPQVTALMWQRLVGSDNQDGAGNQGIITKQMFLDAFPIAWREVLDPIAFHEKLHLDLSVQRRDSRLEQGGLGSPRVSLTAAASPCTGNDGEDGERDDEDEDEDEDEFAVTSVSYGQSMPTAAKAGPHGAEVDSVLEQRRKEFESMLLEQKQLAVMKKMKEAAEQKQKQMERTTVMEDEYVIVDLRSTSKRVLPEKRTSPSCTPSSKGEDKAMVIEVATLVNDFSIQHQLASPSSPPSYPSSPGTSTPSSPSSTSTRSGVVQAVRGFDADADADAGLSGGGLSVQPLALSFKGEPDSLPSEKRLVSPTWSVTLLASRVNGAPPVVTGRSTSHPDGTSTSESAPVNVNVSPDSSVLTNPSPAKFNSLLSFPPFSSFSSASTSTSSTLQSSSAAVVVAAAAAASAASPRSVSSPSSFSSSSSSSLSTSSSPSSSSPGAATVSSSVFATPSSSSSPSTTGVSSPTNMTASYFAQSNLSSRLNLSSSLSLSSSSVPSSLSSSSSPSSSLSSSSLSWSSSPSPAVFASGPLVPVVPSFPGAPPDRPMTETGPSLDGSLTGTTAANGSSGGSTNGGSPGSKEGDLGGSAFVSPYAARAAAAAAASAKASAAAAALKSTRLTALLQKARQKSGDEAAAKSSTAETE